MRARKGAAAQMAVRQLLGRWSRACQVRSQEPGHHSARPDCMARTNQRVAFCRQSSSWMVAPRRCCIICAASMPAVGWQQRRSPRRPRRQYPCRQNCMHMMCACPLQQRHKLPEVHAWCVYSRAPLHLSRASRRRRTPTRSSRPSRWWPSWTDTSSARWPACYFASYCACHPCTPAPAYKPVAGGRRTRSARWPTRSGIGGGGIG